MSENVTSVLSGAYRSLMTNLRFSDEGNEGHPQLSPGELDLAREYLALLLMNGEAQRAHLQLLQEMYRTRFEVPFPRYLNAEVASSRAPAAGFRHNQLLSEEKARAAANLGPEVFNANELASLLLNPYALCDLADLIDLTMPDRWHEEMSRGGRELMERYGLEIGITGSDISRRTLSS